MSSDVKQIHILPDVTNARDRRCCVTEPTSDQRRDTVVNGTA